ncbi:S8 family serine peptidase [Lamprobacter modestohalophilus]|uniref:S8 family serine peptidase n=1 Tax=Lamprobacter modestohalophilus TaxID=1064514 RepID=UPI002ADEAABE|nr:S8 family serine peptidase [Lamprobacter modestohalophilus]MEA1052544.1 S8 family serine peptidase [Lamprobacter modestohalophilus]
MHTVVLLFILVVGASSSVVAAPSRGAPDTGDQFIWYDGDRQRVFTLSRNELGVWLEAGSVDAARDSLANHAPLAESIQAVVPFASVTSIDGRMAMLRSSQAVDAVDPRFGESVIDGRNAWVDGVFRATTDNRGGAYVLTGQMIVHFADESTQSAASAWGRARGVEFLRPLGVDHGFLFTCPAGPECLALSASAKQDTAVKYAYPNWVRPAVTRNNDPLFPEQWHLENTGQSGGLPGTDANVLPVWDSGLFGDGVIIAVVDDGVQIDHEDLIQNVVPGLSFDYVDGDTDPTGGRHGTSVAGVAAARGYNEVGVRGSAPYASLVGYRLLDAKSDTNEANALQRGDQLVSISSHSWGPDDTGMTLEGPSTLTLATFEGATKSGRGGKGTVFVWAGGNGAQNNDNSNYDGYANSRYTIAVAASTNKGTRSWYSEPGANILVNAPSDGGLNELGITTTNRTGGAGYPPGGDYTDIFGGTSSATPLVSGVIALALEANPSLTWRDIKQLLATTAFRNDPLDSDWTTNAAGLWINHQYGYGRIDAEALVDAATHWVRLAPEESVEVEAAPEVSIPDGEGTIGDCGPWVASSLSVARDLSVEFVKVGFQSDHSQWGDLDIRLISPEGTESVLAEPHSNGTGNGFADGWFFGVERLIGERSVGQWTLWVRDCQSGKTGELDSWGVAVYGTDPSSGDASTDSIGLFDPASARLFLSDRLSAGIADEVIRFGPRGTDWIPLTGDWRGKGRAGIGLFDPVTSVFYLKNDRTSGSADTFFGSYIDNWVPLVGDWDGDGVDTVGGYVPDDGTFYLFNTNLDVDPDLVFTYGPSGEGWIPIVGDWDGDGGDSIGLYNPEAGVFHLKDDNRSGTADWIFQYGRAGVSWLPIAGDWDRNGVDGIGLYDPTTGRFFLKNALDAGVADQTIRFGPASSSWIPLSGAWGG